MSVSVAELTMPKKKGPRRDDQAVKIERAIAQQAKFIADRRDLTLGEYLSELLRADVRRDWEKEVKKMSEEAGK
jgi:hypothetical protein